MNNGGESCYWTEVAWIELTIWKWNRQINVLLQSAHYGTNDFSKAVSPLFVFTRRLWHHSAHYIRTRESRLPAIAVEYRRFVGTNCQSDKLQTGKNSTFILFSTFEERILIWDWSAWSVFFQNLTLQLLHRVQSITCESTLIAKRRVNWMVWSRGVSAAQWAEQNRHNLTKVGIINHLYLLLHVTARPFSVKKEFRSIHALQKRTDGELYWKKNSFNVYYSTVNRRI